MSPDTEPRQITCLSCQRVFDPKQMVTVHLKARFPDGTSARLATRTCLDCWQHTENRAAISIVEDEERDRQERD